MKKLRTFIAVCMTMMLGMSGVVFSGVSPVLQAHAETISCTTVLPFELAMITAKDVYTVASCHATFGEANTAMNELAKTQKNVVVRHSSSFSPSKIIAMDRGIAATYDYRSDSTSTINLFTTFDANAMTVGGTTTYTQNHRDMQYLGTMAYNPSNGIGIVKVKVSGFTGYLSLKNTDLIPMIYVDNAWSFTLGGTPSTSPYPEAPFTMVPKTHKYSVINISSTDINGVTHTSRDLIHELYSMWDGRSLGSFTYGPAPSWLPNGVYYSWDGITFYTDRDCLKPVYNGAVVGRYYQYFQYLPLRTQTQYTAQEIDAYVTMLGYDHAPTSLSDPDLDTGSMLFGQGASFISAQTTYGMNALLIFSLAYHESGGGTSTLAITKYNLFGWGAVDSNPINNAKEFTSIEDSINEMMGVHIRGYMSPDTWTFFGSVIGSKGSGMNVKYASDLYWSEKIAGRAYKVDRYLGNKDYGAVDYAIINDSAAVSIEKTAALSTDLYTLSSTLKYKSLIITQPQRITDKLWVKTPSTAPVSTAGTAILYGSTALQLIPYDKELSVGYLLLNNYNFMIPKLVDGKTRSSIETFAWNANKLSIAGYGFFNGYSASSTGSITHTLNLVSSSASKPYPLKDGTPRPTLSTEFGNDLLLYDFATFAEDSIDLSALAPGDYSFSLTIGESAYGISTTQALKYEGELPADQVINEKLYAFTKTTDGNLHLNVSYAILLNNYITTPTNKDITVQAAIANYTLNENSHTFTENGSFTFIATHADGSTVSRTVTITNIDKVSPEITIDPYPTEMQDASITVTASTNEGTLNTNSHTFQNNGSFDFVATDAAGNITTKTVTITNINARYLVNYAVSTGKGTLTAKAGTTALNSGEYLTPGTSLLFTVTPTSGYTVYEWTIDGVKVAGNQTTTLAIENLTKSVSVDVKLVLYGDVNNDQKISTTDIVILRRYLAGLSSLSDIAKISGDYNKDGKVSTTDIVILRRKLAGLE